MTNPLVNTLMTLGSVAIVGIMVFLNIRAEETEKTPPPVLVAVAPTPVVGGKKKPDSDSDYDDYFSGSDLEL